MSDTDVIEETPVVDEVVATDVAVEETLPQENFDDIDDRMMAAAARGDTEEFAKLEEILENGIETPVVVEEEKVEEVVSPEVPIPEVPVATDPVKEVGVGNESFVKMQKLIEAGALREQQFQAQLDAERNRNRQAVAPVAPVETETKLEMPKIPVRPEIPADPSLWEDEHIKANNVYQDEVVKYQTATHEFMSKVGENNAKLQNTFASQQADRDAVVQKEKDESANKGYWNSIEDFQKAVPTFKTEKSIKEIHSDISSFGDRLASLNGVVAGNTPESQQNYFAQKSNLITRYQAGDATIVNSATSAGIDKPQGFDEYTNIAKITKFRADKIAEGELGEKSSLRATYLLMQDSDGTLADAFNDVAVTERERTNRDIAERIKGSQQTVTPPSNMVSPSTLEQSPSSTTVLTQDLTTEEQIFLQEIEINPSRIHQAGGAELYASIESKMK